MYYDKYDVYAKARQYTEDPKTFFEVKNWNEAVFFDGDHNHHLEFRSNHWHCDCREFKRWHKAQVPGYKHFCAHVIALEKVEREIVSNRVDLVLSRDLLQDLVPAGGMAIGAS